MHNIRRSCCLSEAAVHFGHANVPGRISWVELATLVEQPVPVGAFAKTKEQALKGGLAMVSHLLQELMPLT